MVGVILLVATVLILVFIFKMQMIFRQRNLGNMSWVAANEHLKKQVHSSSYVKIPAANKLELYSYDNPTKTGTYTSTSTSTSNSLYFDTDKMTFENVAATFEQVDVKNGKIVEVRVNYTSPTQLASSLLLKCGVDVKSTDAVVYNTLPDTVLAMTASYMRAYGSAGVYGGGIIRQTSDKGYIYVNTVSYPVGPNFPLYLYVVKLNEDLTLQWSKLYGSNSTWAYGNDVQEIPGGYIIAGMYSNPALGVSSAMLMKLNSDGSKVAGWPKNIPAARGGFTRIIKTDGGYLVSGLTSDHRGIVVRTDTDGNPVGSTYVVTNPPSETDPYKQNEIMSITESQGASPGYVLTGFSLTNRFVIKLNTSLGTVWEKRPATPEIYACDNDIKQISDDSYIAAGADNTGKMRLRRINEDGSDGWSQTYAAGETASTVLVVPGGYVISGRTVGTTLGKARFIKTDASGSTTSGWNRSFSVTSTCGGSAGYPSSYYADQAADGGYVIAGPEIYNSVYPPKGVYFEKTDPDGNCPQESKPSSRSPDASGGLQPL